MSDINCSVVERSYNKLHLNITNVPKPFISSLRRTIIGSVPSMRIDKRWYGPKQNIQPGSESSLDFAFGWIPILTNPDLFEMEPITITDGFQKKFTPDYIINDKNGHGIYGRPHYPKEGSFTPNPPSLDSIDPSTTLVFELYKKCYWDADQQKLVNQSVFAQDIKWIPIGNQLEKLINDVPKFPPNYWLYDLGENECIHVILHAVKGHGDEHGKWKGANCYFYDTDESEEANLNKNDVQFIVESLNYPHCLAPDYYLKTGIKQLKQSMKLF